MKNYVYSRIYKLCRAFSWLVAFFIGGFLFSMTCHAQSLPSLSSDTFTLIEGGNNSLFSSGFGSVDVFPYTNDPIVVSQVIKNASQNPLITGAELSAINNTDYNVRKLNDNEIETNENIFPYLYDVHGNIVSWDNVYFVHYDNGFCHGELYVDSNGEILTSDSNNTYSMFQLGFGGYLINASEFANIYSDIALQLGNSQMLYSLNSDIDISNNVMNFYIFGGCRGNYNNSIPWYHAQELYIPNIYDRNLYYVNTYSDWNAINVNTPNQIFCVENPSKYLKTIYNQHGNNYPLYSVQSANYTYNGITYNYVINNSNSYAFRVNSTLMSKENFIDDSNLQTQYCVLNYNKFNYNPNLCYYEDEILGFKVLQPKSGKIIQINDDDYSYNQIKELEETLNDLTSSPNELFDPNEVVSETNFPLDYPYNDPSINISDLPFPNFQVQPNTSPSLTYDSEIQPTPQEIETSINNFGIPFFENLQYKYPFSIPWDIKTFIESFKAEPTPPAWDFDWNITIGNTTYTHHFEGDLSEFNSLAEIFRNLLLISFIIGLCVFSYKSHF